MKTKTRKPRTPRSLTATLAIAFLALSAVILLIFGALQVFSSIATQQGAVAGKLQLNAQDASLRVSNFIQNKLSIMDTAARLTNLTQRAPDEQQQVLDGLLGRDVAFRQVAALNPQGQELAKASRLSQQASGSLADQISGDALMQIQQGTSYISSVYVDPMTSEPLVLVALPVINALGDFQGVLVAEINLKFMWDLIDQIQIGEGGTAYVVDKLGDLIAYNDTARVLRGENVANLTDVRGFIQGNTSGGQTTGELFTGIQGATVVGTFAPLGTPDWAVVVELPWEEAYREVIQNGLASGVILVIMAALAGLLGVYVARRLSVPLVSLTETASKISTGELELQADVSGPNEVAQLATSFNSMTAQLRTLIGELEDRVQARTEQLRASADVGRAAVSILDTDQLLREIVNLITDRFGFYYTAIFLADSMGKWAVLREATGEAGRVLKERGHQLEIGGQSMVGTAMKTRKARIALDVGDEAVRFANPLLPDTRSEIALPLVVGGRVIGALDVQSTQMAAFDEASAAVLQSMADQIAIALSNTQQFQQAQAALQHTRQLYEASTAISNTEDAPAILHELMMEVVTNASAAQILTYGPLDEAGQYAYFEVAASWAASADVQVSPAGTRLTREQVPPLSATANEPYLVSNAADPSVSPAQQQVMQEMGVQAMLAYALLARSQPMGLLVITYREPHMFTPAETQPLQALAGQIATTLHNQQLVREQTLARQQLDEINRRLTGQVWQQYVRERGGVVRKIDVSPGVPRNVSAPLQSEVAAPVVIHGQEIGVLRLEDATPDREWTSTEKALLEAVAGEVAIAIENARLIEQTQRDAQREQTISAITGQIHSTTDVTKLLQITAAELRRATGSVRAVVRLGRASLQSDDSPIQPVTSNDGDTIPSKDGD